MTNEWAKQKIAELRAGQCECGCGETGGLEFAHVKDTELSGMSGRGRNARLFDFLKHREAYQLMRTDCHRSFDRGAGL